MSRKNTNIENPSPESLGNVDSAENRGFSLKDKKLNVAGSVIGGMAFGMTFTPVENFAEHPIPTSIVFAGSAFIGAILGWIGTNRLLDDWK